MSNYTREEVLEMASVLLHNPKPREWKTRAGNMLTAYADALSKPADSGRVGDAMVDRAMTAWNESSFTGGAGLRGRWRESIEAALAQHGQPKISELRMEQLADAAAALDKMGRRDQCRHLMWLHEELQALQHGQPREELPACPHHWHIIYTGTGREEWECTECFQRGGFAERPVSRQGIEQTYNDGYSAGRRTHPERQASAQGEAVAWRIDTDDDVERVAKSVGWDNRRYMTPADYAIWCSRMREFVRLAAGHAAPPASPAAKVIRAENGSCYIEWAAGANMLDYVGASLYTRPASPAGVPDVAAMVDRFLGWALPKDFAPDAGISYNPAVNINQTTGEPYPNTPSGTNLFTAEQAEAMFRYVLAAAPSAPEGGHIDRARFKKAPCYLCGYNGPGYYQPKTHSCADKYHAAAPEGDGGGE